MDNNLEVDLNEITGIISWLESESIPSIKEIICFVEKTLEKAKINRTNCLAAKTTGVTLSGVGSLLTLTGFVMAPATMGVLAAVCSGIGLTLGGLGTATSVGTSIVDNLLQSSDVKDLKEMMENFENLRKELEERRESNPYMELLFLFFRPDFGKDPEGNSEYFSLLRWLKCGNIYSDEEIKIEEIREGDHIFRLTEKKTIVPVFHHGVYLGDGEVVDLTENAQPSIRPLKEYFQGHTTVYRRNYHRCAIPIEETVRLAKEIAENPNWERYHLFKNNCEHFATFLKLRTKDWSEQVNRLIEILNAIYIFVKITPRLVHFAFDSIKVAAKCAKALAKPKIVATPSLWSRMFRKAAAPAAPKSLSAFSKTLIVLGPVMTAVDVAFLVSDWRTKQPNIENLERALKLLKEELRNLTGKVAVNN